jgi:hypothetical protein
MSVGCAGKLKIEQKAVSLRKYSRAKPTLQTLEAASLGMRFIDFASYPKVAEGLQ